MATLTFTFAAGAEGGAVIRQMARVLNQLALDLPDRHSSGASLVLTLDNSPSSGVFSAQITAGPAEYQKGAKRC